MNDSFKPLLVVLLVVVAVGALVAAPRLFAPKEVVTWRSDVSAGRRDATASGKPLLLYFTATWCEPCQRMKHAAFADAGVDRTLRDSYVAVKVDIDQNRSLARQYGIESIPTFKVLGADGQVVRETSGYMDKDQFLSWLRAAPTTVAAMPSTRNDQ